MSNIDDIIEEAARRHGVPIETMRAFAAVESNFNPSLRNHRNGRPSKYMGLYQLSQEEFRKHGGTGNIFDPVQNANAAARKIAAESAMFRKKYGRDATAGDLYMIHNQGEGGAAKHYANPNQPAWVSMYQTGEGRKKGAKWSRDAIWGNLTPEAQKKFGSVDNITSQDFVNFWHTRIGSKGGSKAPLEMSGATPRYSPQSGDQLSNTSAPQPVLYGTLGKKVPDQTSQEPPNMVANPPWETTQTVVTTSEENLKQDLPYAVVPPENQSPAISAMPSSQGGVDVDQSLWNSMEAIPQGKFVPEKVKPDDTVPFVTHEDYRVPGYGAGVNTYDEYDPNRIDRLAELAPEDPSALDKLDAIVEVNSFGDAAQQVGRAVKGIYEKRDPDFQVPREELAEFPVQYQEFLNNSPNATVYAERRADVMQREAANEIIAESGLWTKAANVGLELAPWIAYGVLVDKGFSAAAVAARLSMANRLIRGTVLATAGGAGGYADYKLNEAAGNKPNFALTVGLGIIAGGAFGAFAHASPAARKALGEAAEDAVREEARAVKAVKEAGERALVRDESKPRDFEAEHQTWGTRLDDAVEDKVEVLRTADDAKIRAATEGFDDDMAKIVQNIDSASAHAKPDAPAQKALTEVFERQGHRTEHTVDYYLPMVRGWEDKLAKGVLRLERRMEDAATHFKGDRAQIVRVQVPKGSKVLDGAALKWSEHADSILTKGMVSETVQKTKVADVKLTRNGKSLGKSADVHKYKLEQPKPTGKARPVTMSAKLADGGLKANPEQLAGINSGKPTSGGAAAIRDTAHSPTVLRKITDDMNRIINADLHNSTLEPGGPLEKLGNWYSQVATTAGKLKWGGNKLAATIQPYLMFEGRAARAKDLDAGIVTPRAMDEMKDELVTRWDGDLMAARAKHFDEFAKFVTKEQGKNKTLAKIFDHEMEEFFEDAVYSYRNGLGKSKFEKAPGIAAYAKQVDHTFDNYLQFMADPALAFGLPSKSLRPLAGMDEVYKAMKAEGTKYQPRIYLGKKIMKAQEEFGNDVFRDWLGGAFRSRMRGQAVEVISEETGLPVKVLRITDEKIDALTDKFHDMIIMSRGGFDNAMQALNGSMDINAFIRMAREGDMAIDDELAEFLRAWSRPSEAKTSTAGARTKHRAALDEQYVHRDPAKYGDKEITIHDFVETNVTRLSRSYINSMSGRIAAANTVIKDNKGEILFDGLTNDAEVRKLKDAVGHWGKQNKLDDATNKAIRYHLDNFFDAMFGNVEHKVFNENAELASRWAMLYATIAKMGKAGLNQINEMGNAIADGGIGVINHIPAVRRLYGEIDQMRAAGDKAGLLRMADWIEHEAAVGRQMERSGTAGKNAGQYMWGAEYVDDAGSTALKNAQKLSRATLIGSGMIPFTAQTQKALHHALYSRFTRAARKYKTYDSMPPRWKRKFAAMGLDKEQSERVIKMMRNEKVFMMSSNSFMGRLDFIRSSHPDFDLETMRRFNSGVRRQVTQSIQENKIGAMHPALDTLSGRMLTQFKTFTLGSVTQQWMHRTRQIGGSLKQMKKGAVEGDSALFSDAFASLAEPVSSFVWQGALSLLTYRIYLASQTIGMSDKEYADYMKKRWDDRKQLVSAMVARSGQTGWIPTVWNTLAGPALGREFYLGDARSSGLENTFVPAAYNIFAQDLQAVNKLLDIPRTDKEFSDKDAVKNANILSNFWAYEAIVRMAAQRYLPDDKQGR